MPYILVVAGVGISGGVLAAFWAPGVGARSAVQHFAAGAVISAVASEIVPEVKRVSNPYGVLCGFAAGGLTMIGLKWLVLRSCAVKKPCWSRRGRRGLTERGVREEA